MLTRDRPACWGSEKAAPHSCRAGSRRLSRPHANPAAPLRRAAGWGPGPLAVCLIVVLLAVAYLVFGDKPSSKEQRATVGFFPAIVNFGQIPWRSRHGFSLEFRNPSGQMIEIAEAKTSCGCAVVDAKRLTSDPIAPGTTVQLEGELEAGLQDRPVECTVTAVDSRGNSYTATLRANVMRTWEVSPLSLDFGRIAPEDGTVALELTVRPPTVRLVAAPTTDVEWLSATADGPRVVVRADVKALPSGQHVGRVNLATDDPYVPTFSVPASVIRTSSITLIPTHAFLVDERPVTVRAEDPQGRPVKVVDWRASDTGVDVETASLEG